MIKESEKKKIIKDNEANTKRKHNKIKHKKKKITNKTRLEKKEGKKY